MAKGVDDMRWQMRGMLWPLILLILLGYFGHLAWQGRAGLAEQRALAARAAALKMRLAELRAERARLEARVAAMRPRSRDLDLLDEVARRNLGYLRPDERVIVVPPAEPAAAAR